MIKISPMRADGKIGENFLLVKISAYTVCMEIDSVNTSKLVNCFHFQVMPLKTFHADYITLHNLSMLLTHVILHYNIHPIYYRDVVSIFIIIKLPCTHLFCLCWHWILVAIIIIMVMVIVQCTCMTLYHC